MIGASWFGRLLGDIVIERGPVTVYLPLATCLLLSVVLSLPFWLFRSRASRVRPPSDGARCRALFGA